MQRRGRSLLIPPTVAGMVVVCASLVVLAGEKEDPVVIAARKRQEAVKTLVAELKVTQVIPRGGLSKVLVPPFNEPLPGKETTFESDNRLVIDRDKIRYEDNHMHTFRADRKVVQTSIVWLYDGSTTTMFAPKVAGDTGSRSAIINAGHHDYGSPLMVPIAFTFRGLSSRVFPVGMTEMKPTGATVSIDGVQCEEYRFDTHTYYLDPNQDFVVRRIQDKLPNQLSRQYEIQYRQDAAQRWVPAAWQYKDFSPDGEARGTIKVDVTKMRINEPLLPGEFEIKFPEGTWVHDQRDDKNYRVQADGGLREYDIVTGAALPMPIAPPAHWYQNKWLLVGGAIVLAVGFVGAYFLRRGRVKAA